MYDRSLAAEVARLKRQVAQLSKGQRYAHGGSIENAALEVRDDIGTLRGIVGQQGDGTTAVTIVNGGPPPTPSTPTAGSALGGISAGWDGTFADGAVIPLDWSRVEVHASPATGFTPTADTLKATIETAQGGIIYVPAAEPQYVRLLARNTSGAASDPTGQVGPYAPTPISDEIGPGGITTTLIADDAITTPKLFANAVTTPKLAAGSVDATAIKADAITGKTITGGTITGATVQTAASGSRVTLDTKMKLYNASNQLLAEATPSGGITNDAGFICYNTVGVGRYYAMLSRGYLLYGKEGVSYAGLPGIDHLVVSGNNSAMRLYSGSIGVGSGVQSSIYMGSSSDGGATPAHVDIGSDASNARCDLKVTGVVSAGNVVTGTVNITPSAASTPTSMLVNFSVIGTNPRGYATAVTTVPGVRAPTGNAGVTGVSVSSVTNSSMLVWVNRENTTITTINWRVEASL